MTVLPSAPDVREILRAFFSQSLPTKGIIMEQRQDSTTPVTSQPSSAQTSTSQASSPATGSGHSIIGDLLKTLGVGENHVTAVHDATQSGDINKQIDQTHSYITEAINHAREQAQKNPGAVLGGLSALVIAAGMMRNNLRR